MPITYARNHMTRISLIVHLCSWPNIAIALINLLEF